jgi:excisionase family DNA binding protein
MAVVEKFLTLAELARAVGISYPTALRYVRNSVIHFDAISGSSYLFRASRLEQLRFVILTEKGESVPPPRHEGEIRLSGF